MMKRQDYSIGSPPPFTLTSSNYYAAPSQIYEPSYGKGVPQTQSIKFNDNAAPFEFREQKSSFELEKHFPSINETYFGFGQPSNVKPFQPTISYVDN